MTVLTDDNKAFATGNGITTSFTFTFRCLAEEHLQIYVDETLRPGNEYTVTINANGVGGAIEFDDPPDDGLQVLIYRFVDYTQESALPNEDDFQQITLENALDKLTMEVQQLQEQLDRAAKSSLFDENPVSIVLPTPVSRRALLWHTSEDGRLINSTYDPDELFEQASQALEQIAILVAQVEAALAACLAAQAAAEAAATNAETTVNNVTTGFPGIANWSSNNAVGDLLVWDEVAPSVFGFRNLGAGANGEVLTSNGANIVPSWQDAAGGSLPFVTFETDGLNNPQIAQSNGVASVVRTANPGQFVITLNENLQSLLEPLYVGILNTQALFDNISTGVIGVQQTALDTVVVTLGQYAIPAGGAGSSLDLQLVEDSEGLQIVFAALRGF